MNPDVRHAYGIRAWIRVHLPFWLIDLGVASKGRDCEAVGSDHHRYNVDDKCSACYYCRVVQQGQLWRDDTASLRSESEDRIPPPIASGPVVKMMREEAAIEAIVQALPSFRSAWLELVREWQDEPTMPWYLAMGELAHHLVESYERGSTAEFGQFFAAVERLLLSADSSLTNLIGVGLFEDIQNIASHRRFGGDVFISWLAPESLRLWREVDEGMRHVAAWSARRYRKHWWQFWRPRQLDFSAAVDQIENAELRKIVEANYRETR